MILCPKCGKANAPLTPRCVECGQPLTASAPAPPPAYTPPPGYTPPATQPPPYTAPPQSPTGYTPPPTVQPAPTAMPVTPPYAPQSAPYPGAPARPVGMQPQPPYAAPPAGYTPPTHYYTPTGYAAPPMGMPGPYGAAPAAYCLVCGAALPAIAYIYCPVCTAPSGTVANPNDPTATTFLTLAEVQRFASTPHAAASVLPTGIPPIALPRQVRLAQEDPKQGWNWAAALITTPWAFRHKVWWAAIVGSLNLVWGLLLLGAVIAIAGGATGSPDPDHSNDLLFDSIAVLSILFCLFKTFYLGFHGNRLAWNSHIYPDIAQMRKAQGLWTGWAIMIFCVISILAGVAFALALAK